jgi:hypothetical protein
VDWIYQAQDRHQWWPLVSMVMKLSGSIKGGEFMDELSDSLVPQEGLYSMELMNQLLTEI